MILASKLDFSYNSKQQLSFPPISGEPDNPCLIIGPSGCGKTTLLHLLGGLMKPTKGSIRVGDQDITQLKGSSLDKFRGKHIGIIFQKSHFVRSLNVLDNLLIAPYFGSGKVDKHQAIEILESLGLGDKLYQSPSTLSQGEQQRLSIARVLINEPVLILADEPTSALDDINCDEVIKLLIDKAKAANAALIIVTHDGRLKEIIPNQVILSTPSN
ncbi:MAG: ATP-binding cassette domain-containing protein [Bacteroidia bacterium]|nr:ATP-binding cassette domain-containing protein [Bacteroidia bacterium]